MRQRLARQVGKSTTEVAQLFSFNERAQSLVQNAVAIFLTSLLAWLYATRPGRVGR